MPIKDPEARAANSKRWRIEKKRLRAALRHAPQIGKPLEYMPGKPLKNR